MAATMVFLWPDDDFSRSLVDFLSEFVRGCKVESESSMAPVTGEEDSLLDLSFLARLVFGVSLEGLGATVDAA